MKKICRFIVSFIILSVASIIAYHFNFSIVNSVCIGFIGNAIVSGIIED